MVAKERAAGRSWTWMSMLATITAIIRAGVRAPLVVRCASLVKSRAPVMLMVIQVPSKRAI